jgi:tryptophan synthase alpha chain
MLPHERITNAIRSAEGPAIVAFLTAGYPDPDRFLDDLRVIAEHADAVEIGVPFSDPMADGVTLRWILERLRSRDFELDAPILLMGYLNPFLTYGYERLADDAADAGVSGFMVPDLPYEESAPLREALEPKGLALVQFVTPATPPERLRAVSSASQGFVYAVTKTGITGGGSALPEGLSDYLSSVKSASPLPVCAGFGVRSSDQVAAIAAHADGVIVGSALVELLEQRGDVAGFLAGLRSGQ